MGSLGITIRVQDRLLKGLHTAPLWDSACQATFPLVTFHFSKTACPCPLLTLMPSVLTLWRLLSRSPHLCKCSHWLLAGPTVPGKPALVFQFHTRQELVQDDGIQPDYTVTLLEWVQWTLRLLFWPKSSHLLWDKQQWTVPWNWNLLYQCACENCLSAPRVPLQRSQTQLTGRLEHPNPELFLDSWPVRCSLFWATKFESNCNSALASSSNL